MPNSPWLSESNGTNLRACCFLTWKSGEWCPHHCGKAASLPRVRTATWEGGHIAGERDWLTGGYCNLPLVTISSLSHAYQAVFSHPLSFSMPSMFVLEKVMLRFSKDYLKVVHLNMFLACFERKVTHPPFLWIRERWGRSFNETLIFGEFFLPWLTVGIFPYNGIVSHLGFKVYSWTS